MMNNEREAKVVITADTKKYNKSVEEAHKETEKLNKGLGETAKKLDGIIKRTGKKMMLFGGAGLAGLTGTTTAAATLEKQLSDLEAQFAMLGVQGKNAGQNMEAAFASAKQNVRDLSRDLPMARREIAAVQTAISGMGISDVKTQNKMTEQFIDLGSAVGESPIAVAQGTIDLQRQMGMQTRSDALTAQANAATAALNAESGLDASAILGFSSYIAPTASIAGMSEDEVKGVSTAFLRAGADGQRSANIFNKLVNDITYMQSTGSPDLDKYANVLGFSSQDIQSATPVDILNQLQDVAKDPLRGQQVMRFLGFDSIRAQKALQGLSNAGGVNQWIDTAKEADPKTVEEGAKAAQSGFFDEMAVLRNKLTDFITAIGEPLLVPLTTLAKAFGDLVSVVEPFFNAIGKVISAIGGAGSLALLAGGTMLRSWALGSTPIIAKRVASSTMVQSVRAGITHGGYAAAGRARPNDMIGRALDTPRGQPGGLGIFNRGLYNMSHRLGFMFPRDEGGLVRGNPFRTATNMALMGVGGASSWLMNMTRDHYQKGMQRDSPDRIKGERRGVRGIWGNFKSAATVGATQTFFGSKPGGPGPMMPDKDGIVAGSSSSIDEHEKSKSRWRRMVDRVSREMDRLKGSLRTMTKTVVETSQGITRSLWAGFKAATTAAYELAKALATAAGSTALATSAGAALARSGADFDRNWADAKKHFGDARDQATNAGKSAGTKIHKLGSASVVASTAAFNTVTNKGKQAAEQANTAATTQNTKSKLAEARVTARTTPVMTVFRQQLAKTGGSFIKLAASASKAALSLGAIGLGAGVRMAGKGITGAARGLGGMAAGMLGVSSGPAAAALAGAAVVGYGTYKTMNAGNEAEEKLGDFYTSLSGSTSGLKSYNDALGKSTVALNGLTAAASKPATSFTEATDLRRAQAAAVENSEYTNKDIEAMDRNEVMNWVGTMRNVPKETAELIMADVVRKYGVDSAETKQIQELLQDSSKNRGGMRLIPQDDQFNNQQASDGTLALGGMSQKFGNLDARYDFEGVGFWTNLASMLGWNQSAYIQEDSPLLGKVRGRLQTANQNIDNKLADMWSLDEEEDAKIQGRVTLSEYAPVFDSAVAPLTNRQEQMQNALGPLGDSPLGGLITGLTGGLLDKTPFAPASPMQAQGAQAQLTGVGRALGWSEEYTKQWISDLNLENSSSTEFGETPEEREKYFARTIIERSQALGDTRFDDVDIDNIHNFDDIIKQTTSKSSAQTIQTLNEQAADTGDSRMSGAFRATGTELQELMKTDGNDIGVVADALLNIEDPEKQLKAQKAMQKSLESIAGASTTTADKITQLANIGALSPELKAITDAAIESEKKKEGRELTGANKAVQLESFNQYFQSTLGRAKVDTTGEAIVDLNKQKEAAEDQIASMYQMWRQYEISREREEEDYLQNRAWQQEDYDRQLMYQKEDFYRSRRHQTEDFNRQMERQEEAHQIRLQRMIEDYAKSMYDPYSRMMGQGSRSGGSMLFNLEHQEEILSAQLDSIEKLKEKGLSDEAIEMLDLLNPNKAQQANHWANAGELSDKEIKELNAAVGRRSDISEEFVTHDNNTQFQRMEEDRARQIKHAVEDFTRGMRRAMNNWLRQLDRGLEAYLRSIHRADVQREKSLRRAEEDLLGFLEDSKKSTAEQAEFVMGKLKEINTDVSNNLKGQVQTVLDLIAEADGFINSTSAPDPTDPTDPTATGSNTGTNPGFNLWDAVLTIGRNLPFMETGGIVQGQQLAWVGEKGPEAIIPLNSRGADFMAELFASMHTIDKNMPMGESASAMQVYNNNTNFNGEIHIKANNPNEIAEQLKHRKRMDSLRGGKGTTVFS